MKNIKDFEQYNEGLKDWASKKFNPGELGEQVKDIFAKIKNEFKNEFNVNKLTMGHEAGESRIKYYEYRILHGPMISVSLGGGEYNRHPELYLEDKNITSQVNMRIIVDIYTFLDEKYKNKTIQDKSKENMKKVESDFYKRKPSQIPKRYNDLDNRGDIYRGGLT